MTWTLEDAAGADWWNSGKVPQTVQQEVNRRLKTEEESGMTQRSTDLIDYTTFGELSVIISANWDHFKTVLTNQAAMQRVLRDLNLLRNPVAHCSPMADDEVERLRLSVNDWFRLMGEQPAQPPGVRQGKGCAFRAGNGRRDLRFPLARPFFARLTIARRSIDSRTIASKPAVATSA